jgi:glycosyltransferase involved in cell wall biosynthesis
MVDGYAIEIVTSPDFKTLTDLYGKAKFFWSASGYGEDEEKNPEKVEHFGITVIEAMAGGAVPVIFAAGGHKEIIKDGENGLLWAKEKDLLVDTTLLINNKQRWRNVSESARMGSKKYGYERFKSDIEKIL